jgi:nucleotide-binding universal stress UspA family protein
MHSMHYWKEASMTTTRLNRIVVGVTGSLANLAALHAAVDQARRCDAPLVAVRTWLPVGGEIAYRRGPCPPLLQVWRQQARSELTLAFVDAFGGLPTDLAVDCITVRGEAGPRLVAAADHPDDLLVVGAGRRGRLAGIRFGSVARFCFTHACCPVLAVPPPEMIRELRSRRLPRPGDTVEPFEEPASLRPRYQQ